MRKAFGEPGDLVGERRRGRIFGEVLEGGGAIGQVGVAGLADGVPGPGLVLHAADAGERAPAFEDAPEAEMDALMLDGNAVAGLLQDLFALEMATAIGTYGRCGAAGPVGAVHVYRGAGIVLRCAHCSNTLAKIVKSDSRVWIDSTGIRTLEVAI
jgi:Family of unknown function (DUF6510)